MDRSKYRVLGLKQIMRLCQVGCGDGGLCDCLFKASLLNVVAMFQRLQFIHKKSFILSGHFFANQGDIVAK